MAEFWCGNCWKHRPAEVMVVVAGRRRCKTCLQEAVERRHAGSRSYPGRPTEAKQGDIIRHLTKGERA